MNLIEFRKKYPQAAFIDDEDVKQELEELNELIDYKGHATFDIDSFVSFYKALYNGGK